MALLTIGAFARLARLSPKALRLYESQALLKPVRVDPDTGYRWYSPDQLDRARQVALLRRLDMPLARIGQVIDLPPRSAAAALTAFWDEQEQRVRARRQLVGFLVNQLTGTRSIMYEVSVRDVPARVLLSVGEHLSVEQVPEFAAPLFALFAGPGVPRPHGVVGLPFLRYRGEPGADSDAGVEFCCPIEESEADAVAARYPDMTCGREPAVREAFVRVPKRDMHTLLGLESLSQWLTERGERADWAPRQIFLADPGAVTDDDTVYEVAVTLV